MVALSVNGFGYLEVSSDDWLTDIAEYSEEMTESLRAWPRWVTYPGTADIADWARETFGEVSGIYGENGPVSILTCNEETFLSDDIGFVFMHAGDETLIVVNATSYMSRIAAHCEVYRFIGDDDADIASYSRGYAVHDSDSNCGTDWILDSPGTLWANGGGQSVPVSDCIKETEEYSGEWKLYCPNCGIVLHPFTN